MTALRPTTLAVALALALTAPFVGAADSAASAAAPVASAPAPLAAGIDRSGADPAVRPQDSLFYAVNGGWVKKTEIPADKRDYGSFTVLEELSDHRVKAIVDGLAAKPQPEGSVAAKVGAFYAGFMDTAAIDAAGMKPVAPYLAQVDAVRTKADLLHLMGDWVRFVDLPLNLGVGPDAKDPGVYSAGTSQGGLGLGQRDYYLKPDARFAKARTAYLEYLRKTLAAAGSANPKADAAAVMALETKLARVQWTPEANRDPVKTYNPMTIAAITAKAPGLDWKGYLAAGELVDPPFVSISQPSYTWAFAKLVQSQPLDAWKAYLRAHIVDTVARELPADVREARFQFRGVALLGTPSDRPRWEQAVATLNDSLGEAVGQVYVSEYFPPAYKARMVEMVGNILKAFDQSIDNLAWMSPVTKVQAHAKLAKYGVKIGYPDVWRDYSALDIKPGDAVGNALRATQFEYHRQAVRNTKPVDRTEWGMTPQTVNAYYDGTKNEIVFPAAILQPPFFDMKADDAANYGAIGGIIGHEISHGFDDEGSQYDGDGKLRNWWTPQDRKAFDEITGKLVAQFSAYEALPGVHVKGKLTLGENIADLSGLQMAWRAWKLSLGGKPSPVIDGMTGEERFFYGFSQAWREKLREEFLLRLLSADPHSPGRFRADGAAMNLDAFHETFATKPGDKMWKAPADRIRLW